MDDQKHTPHTAPMSYVHLSNGSILYVTSQGNSNSSNVLIFVHGIGATHTFFEPLVEVAKLASTYRIILYDREGAGVSKTNKTSGTRTLQSHVDDLALLIDTLGVSKISLFGHSMGSLIVAEYAIQNPKKVHKLVLNGAAQTPYKDEARAMQRGLSATVSEKGMTSIIPIFIPVLTAPSASPLSKALSRAMLLAQDPDGYVSAVNILANTEKAIEYGKLGGKEVLVLGGDTDVISGDGGDIVALIPGAKHGIVKGVGHSLVVEDPEQTANVVNEFLRQS